MVTASGFANAGQVCVTADRFYVHESQHDKFVSGFAARAKSLKLGHGLDETSQMGPLINQRRVDAMETIVADAKKRGGRIETGGGRPAKGARRDRPHRRSQSRETTRTDVQ